MGGRPCDCLLQYVCDCACTVQGAPRLRASPPAEAALVPVSLSCFFLSMILLYPFLEIRLLLFLCI